MNLVLEGGLSAAAVYLVIKLIATRLPPILPKPDVVRHLTEEDMRAYVPSAVYQEATSRLLHDVTDLRKEIARLRMQIAYLKEEIQETCAHTEKQPKKRVLEL